MNPKRIHLKQRIKFYKRLPLQKSKYSTFWLIDPNPKSWLIRFIQFFFITHGDEFYFLYLTRLITLRRRSWCVPNIGFNPIKCFNKSLRQKFAQKTYQNSKTCESENEILRLHQIVDSKLCYAFLLTSNLFLWHSGTILISNKNYQFRFTDCEKYISIN